MMHATDLETPERGLALETRGEPPVSARKRSEPADVRALREEAA